MAKILVKFEKAVIKELVLEKDTSTFGRKDDNDIVINHPAVSGHHGKIIKEHGLFHVIDLGSTNGTFMGGRKINRAQLKNGDSIRVAKHILEFIAEANDAAASTPPPPSEPGVKTPKGPEEQKQVLREGLGIGQPGAIAGAKIPLPGAPQGPGATIKIISGAVDTQTEIHLKELVTYIGSAAQAAIKIKGFLAPDLAAAISQRKKQYFLKAVKPGYPKVNGTVVQEQVLLESGALIECGGTNMVFYVNTDKDPSKKNEEKPG